VIGALSFAAAAFRHEVVRRILNSVGPKAAMTETQRFEGAGVLVPGHGKEHIPLFFSCG
jgi:hypothetical protein